MQQINIEQLKNLQAIKEVMLIDVRELFEHEVNNIGGTLIPLGDIMNRSSGIPKDKPVVLYCQKGIRSQIAIQRLEEKYGFTNLINLQGGLEAVNKKF